MKSVWLLALVAAVAGCGEPATPPPDTSNGQRIVTLAPHLTELVFSAGAGDRLVGVVAYSDFPEAAQALPVIGDAFRIDPEQLAAVDPDLVLAWEGGNPDEALDQLETRGYRVIRLATESLFDVADNLEAIGRLTGTGDMAQRAAGDYRAALEKLAATHRGREPITVFYQVSPQPLYTVGGRHAISDMIRVCGGRNVFDDLGQLAPVVSLEAVIDRDPEVIIASNYGDPLERWRGWPDLSAARNGNLYTVDAALVTRPGLRMLEGTRAVCRHLDEARQNRD